MRRLNETGSIKGTVTFRNFNISTPRAQQIDELLSATTNVPRETYCALIDELAALCEVKTLSVHNQVLLAARAEMAKRLIGTQAYTGTINYGALGTGSTAVSDADVALDAEAARVHAATVSQTDDEITLDFYFNKSSTSGTFEEFGTFIDSDLLFNRALTGGWVKTSLEAMTVSVQIQLNHA